MRKGKHRINSLDREILANRLADEEKSSRTIPRHLPVVRSSDIPHEDSDSSVFHFEVVPSPPRPPPPPRTQRQIRTETDTRAIIAATLPLYEDSAVQTMEYHDIPVQTTNEYQIDKYSNSCGVAIDKIMSDNYVSEEQLMRERIRNNNLARAQHVQKIFAEMGIDPYKLNQYREWESDGQRISSYMTDRNYVGSRILTGLLDVRVIGSTVYFSTLNGNKYEKKIRGSGFILQVEQLLPHVWIVHEYDV